MASVPSKLSASDPVLCFLPTPVPAGRQGSWAEDWVAPGGLARLGHPPGGLVWDGSGCLWWIGRNLWQGGRCREGLSAKLAVSFGCPAWGVSSSACAARPAQLPHSTGLLQAELLEGISFSGAQEQACSLHFSVHLHGAVVYLLHSSAWCLTQNPVRAPREALSSSTLRPGCWHRT